jgi:hypothetical protein
MVVSSGGLSARPCPGLPSPRLAHASDPLPHGRGEMARSPAKGSRYVPLLFLTVHLSSAISLLSSSPRGARSRGVARSGSRTRSCAGSRKPYGRRPRLHAGPALGSGPGSRQWAPPQPLIGGSASPVRLKEPCARALPALALSSHIEPDRLSRHPSIHPSGWSPTAPARRRWFFDRSSHEPRPDLTGVVTPAASGIPQSASVLRARGRGRFPY